MFPAKPTFRPAFLKMWYIREVVVVLPLDPVMHTIFALVYLPASSISEMIGVPCCFSFTMIGAVSGIPGLFTTSSALSIFSSVWCPSSHSMLYWFSSFWYLGLIADMSETNVSNPFVLASTAAPAPLSPAPKTTILFIIILSLM